jgi:hypothetical protein
LGERRSIAVNIYESEKASVYTTLWYNTMVKELSNLSSSKYSKKIEVVYIHYLWWEPLLVL